MSYARIGGKNVSWKWLREHPDELRTYLANRPRPKSEWHINPRRRTAADDRRDQIAVIQELGRKLDGIEITEREAAKMLRDAK